MRAAIVKAAEALREDLEAFSLYWGKVHGAEISVEKMENGHLSLMGCCAIASWVMWRALQRAGFGDADMVAGWYIRWDDGKQFLGSHCWVTVEGQLIDLTATQFGRPEPVYVSDPGQDLNYSVLSLGRLYNEASYTVRKWKAATGAEGEALLMDWDSQSPFRRAYRPDLQTMEDKVVEMLREAA